MRQLYSQGIIALVAILSATPVLSQANFENLSLSPGFGSAQVTGSTGGSYSLPSISNKDARGDRCIGFADETPDHIMDLQEDFSSLKLQVNSGGNDTTLVIQGPNQFTLCGDDTGSNKDASIEAQDLKAGRYSIWVGSLEEGQTWNYALTVRE